MKAPSTGKMLEYVGGALVVAACAVALYERAAAVPEPMKPGELSRVARKLASDAVEAEGLARALATGQLTTHFARTQHEQLSQDLQDIRASLDQPPPAGAEARARKLTDAARRLDEALKSVPARMADAQSMAQVANDEGAIAREVGAGGGS